MSKTLVEFHIFMINFFAKIWWITFSRLKKLKIHSKN